MKYWVIFFVFISLLLGCINAQSVHDEACNKIQKQGVASCFDRSTLGFCMKVDNEWRAFEAAICDTRLCCNAEVMGCTMDADCKSELTTSSALISTTTQLPVVECVVGNLKKHETDCKRYYYCSKSVWVEGSCSAGVFDENQKSCIFGKCSTI